MRTDEVYISEQDLNELILTASSAQRRNSLSNLSKALLELKQLRAEKRYQEAKKEEQKGDE